MIQIPSLAMNALEWIASVLGKSKIPFQVSGGLAAIAYGSKRPLADIDLDVPEEYFEQIFSITKPYVIRPPTSYSDENWKLTLMTLNYYGQEIDIGGAYQTQIFDSTKNQWVELKADFNSSKRFNFGNISILVVSKESLIAYKSKLGRDVDLQDIIALDRKI